MEEVLVAMCHGVATLVGWVEQATPYNVLWIMFSDLLPLLYQPLLLVTLCFSELLGGLSRSSKLNACVLLFKLSHPCCSKSCLQRKTSWYFSLKYHLPGSLLIEKVICAGRFLWLVLCKWIQIIFLLDCCQRLYLFLTEALTRFPFSSSSGTNNVCKSLSDQRSVPAAYFCRFCWVPVRVWLHRLLLWKLGQVIARSLPWAPS